MDRPVRLVASLSLAALLQACVGDDTSTPAVPPEAGGGSDAAADQTVPGDDGGSDAPVDSKVDGGLDATDAADASTTHSPCVPGAALPRASSACATVVCDEAQGAEPYCCAASWDLTCAEIAHSMCAATCPSDPIDGGLSSLGGTPHTMTQIAAREGALCAVSVLGDVWCWGSENVLGDGSEQLLRFPRRIVPPVPTRTIALATDAVCALGSDDAVRCWGRFPVASSGPSNPVLTPPTTPLVTGASGLGGDRGLVSGNDFMCVATRDGGAVCWGETTSTLGPGVSPPTTTPAAVDLSSADAGTNVAAIFGGGASMCALVGTGTPLCWGDNTTGMLGHQGFGGAAPVVLPLTCLPASDQDGGPNDCASSLSGITKIAIGASSLCALDASGVVRCLGSDAKGALGAGLDGGTFTGPQTVSGVAATDIAVGASHACAVPVDAASPVVCWGSNATGQLGDGFDGGSSEVPVAVPGLVGVKQVVAWSGGSCALKRDGTVWCWGANDSGQLARGATSGPPSPTPVQIPFLSFP